MLHNIQNSGTLKAKFLWAVRLHAPKFWQCAIISLLLCSFEEQPAKNTFSGRWSHPECSVPANTQSEKINKAKTYGNFPKRTKPVYKYFEYSQSNCAVIDFTAQVWEIVICINLKNQETENKFSLWQLPSHFSNTFACVVLVCHIVFCCCSEEFTCLPTRSVCWSQVISVFYMRNKISLD